jgi:succinoglycan biosynthesis protein ExoM
MDISVCIATYRRTDRLRDVLDDLARQSVLPRQVVVVDNDVEGSARDVVDTFMHDGAPFELRYDVQPERNIAATRNRTVALADGEWLAFIDDDERAPEQWLEGIMAAAERFGADGVLGPVQPELPKNAPRWIQRGKFYDFPRMQTGAIVPLNRMRFGNLVLRGTPLRTEPGPFDTRYGLSTGEDGDLLVRMARKGARIVWCDEAVVMEPVEPKRLSLRWLLMRAISGGQEFARQTVNGRYRAIGWMGRMSFFCVALAQMVIAGALALLSCPVGRHWAAGWLIRASANFGKLSVFWGWRYRAYA